MGIGSSISEGTLWLTSNAQTATLTCADPTTGAVRASESGVSARLRADCNWSDALRRRVLRRWGRRGSRHHATNEVLRYARAMSNRSLPRRPVCTDERLAIVEVSCRGLPTTLRAS